MSLVKQIRKFKGRRKASKITDAELELVVAFIKGKCTFYQMDRIIKAEGVEIRNGYTLLMRGIEKLNQLGRIKVS